MKKETNKEIWVKTCPLCLGKGTIISASMIYKEVIRDRARKLYRKGMSLRAIGKILGIDHPMKVKSLIERKTI